MPPAAGHEIEQAAQVLQNKAVKYLDGALKAASSVELAPTRLVACGGAKTGLDDLTKMMRVLQGREALAQFAQALPARTDKFDGGWLDKTRAALDALRAENGDPIPFALALVGQRLAASWQLMRLATRAVGCATGAATR